MKRWLFPILALCTTLPQGAQNQSPESEALRWSLALGGRFRDLREPVVAAHAIGNLAVLMCPYDRTSASALFQASSSGCDKCGGTGYKGRIGIHEILALQGEMGSAVRELVNKKVSSEAIKATAVKTEAARAASNAGSCSAR